MEDWILSNYQPSSSEILSLDDFINLDNAAIKTGLPIHIMMEQAGYQLARLAYAVKNSLKSVLVGVGPGNNGGGGLVAARRLKAWGIDVTIHCAKPNGNPLYEEQLKRCLNFGISTTPNWQADVLIDAYLGFSQRLPLDVDFIVALNNFNQSEGKKISLDLPTGIGDNVNQVVPDTILCLAAAKTALLEINPGIPIYISDLGIPFHIYIQFGFKKPIPFQGVGVVRWER